MGNCLTSNNAAEIVFNDEDPEHQDLMKSILHHRFADDDKCASVWFPTQTRGDVIFIVMAFLCDQGRVDFLVPSRYVIQYLGPFLLRKGLVCRISISQETYCVVFNCTRPPAPADI